MARDSAEFARLASLDSGVEVTPEDVRRYFLIGERAFERFDADTRHEIVTSLMKELGRA